MVISRCVCSGLSSANQLRQSLVALLIYQYVLYKKIEYNFLGTTRKFIKDITYKDPTLRIRGVSTKSYST